MNYIRCSEGTSIVLKQLILSYTGNTAIL